jgi:hypothetical protein
MTVPHRLFLDANVWFAAAASSAGASAMLLSLCQKGHCTATVTRLILREAEKNLKTLRAFQERGVSGRPRRIVLLFSTSPVRIEGQARVERLVIGANRLEAGPRGVQAAPSGREVLPVGPSSARWCRAAGAGVLRRAARRHPQRTGAWWPVARRYAAMWRWINGDRASSDEPPDAVGRSPHSSKGDAGAADPDQPIRGRRHS